MTDIKFHPPKGTIALEAEATIIVPSTKGVKTQLIVSKKEMDNRVDGVRKFLSKLFGGYTSVAAVGGYVMQKGDKLIKEDVVMVTVFGDKTNARVKQKEVIKKIQNLCVEYQQEVIGLIYEGDFFMIGRKKN